jgi:hypothetical protein
MGVEAGKKTEVDVGLRKLGKIQLKNELDVLVIVGGRVGVIVDVNRKGVWRAGEGKVGDMVETAGRVEVLNANVGTSGRG